MDLNLEYQFLFLIHKNSDKMYDDHQHEEGPENPCARYAVTDGFSSIDEQIRLTMSERNAESLLIRFQVHDQWV